MADALTALDAIQWMFPHDGSFGNQLPSLIKLRADGDWIVEELTAHCSVIRGIPPEDQLKTHRGRNRPLREDLFTEAEETGLHLEITAKLNDFPNGTLGALFDPSQMLVFQDLFLWPSVGISQRERSSPRMRHVMMGPYSHRNQPLILRNLSRLIENDFKDRLIALLAGIDPDLIDIEIITAGSFDRPTLLVKHRRAGSMPISVLGDGFRRALSIALALFDARGGVLLVDEIETAFHVSVLDKVFPWMMDLAEELDVQIFATTHSLEAIQAMSTAQIIGNSGGLAAFHLNSDGNGAKQTKRYSMDMLSRLVLERGLDIR